MVIDIIYIFSSQISDLQTIQFSSYPQREPYVIFSRLNMVDFRHRILWGNLQVQVVTLSDPRLDYLYSRNFFSHHLDLQLIFLALDVLVKQPRQHKEQVPLRFVLDLPA